MNNQTKKKVIIGLSLFCIVLILIIIVILRQREMVLIQSPDNPNELYLIESKKAARISKETNELIQQIENSEKEKELEELINKEPEFFTGEKDIVIHNDKAHIMVLVEEDTTIMSKEQKKAYFEALRKFREYQSRNKK